MLSREWSGCGLASKKDEDALGLQTLPPTHFSPKASF